MEHFDEDCGGRMDSDVRDALDQLDSATTDCATAIFVPAGADVSPGETPRPRPVPKPRSIQLQQKAENPEEKDREIPEVRRRDDAENGGVGVRSAAVSLVRTKIATNKNY